MEQILDESDAVGLMQLQCKEAKDDASVMIFPTTDTLPLQKQASGAQLAKEMFFFLTPFPASSDISLTNRSSFGVDMLHDRAPSLGQYFLAASALPALIFLFLR